MNIYIDNSSFVMKKASYKLSDIKQIKYFDFYKEYNGLLILFDIAILLLIFYYSSEGLMEQLTDIKLKILIAVLGAVTLVWNIYYVCTCHIYCLNIMFDKYPVLLKINARHKDKIIKIHDEILSRRNIKKEEPFRISL